MANKKDNKPKHTHDIFLSANSSRPLPRDPETGEILIDDLTDDERETLKRIANEMADALSNIVDAAGVKDSIAAAVKSIGELFNTHVATNFITAAKTQEYVQSISALIEPYKEFYNELHDLKPFITAELQKDEYNGQTIEQILDAYTIGEIMLLRHDKTSLIYKVFEAAKAARIMELPTIDTSRTDKLKTPIDRVNFLAWDDFKATDGQIRFNLMSEKDKRDPERKHLNISMTYSLSFADNPNIKVSKELQHYDRRMQQAIDTLFTEYSNNGQPVTVLIGDIFRAMGNTKEPGTDQRKKLNDSLTKQGDAHIYMNNKAEADHYNYPEIHYDGKVLNFERIRVKYNEQEVTAIKILRRPVLMEFAEQRKQMTAVPLKVLQSGISQTNNHLRIEDYLIYRISRAKNDIKELQEAQQKRYTQNRQKQITKASKLKILLQTFHENVGTAGKSSTERKRAENTAGKYLNHYKDCDYITDYSIKADSISITLPTR